MLSALSAVLAVLLVAEAGPVAGAGASADARLVERLNSLRASRGLAPLTVDPELSAVARSWSARMAQEGRLSHNPDLPAQAPPRWVMLGEAVGAGADADAVHESLAASGVHHRTMTDPHFDAVGVGTAVAGDGRLFATLDFLASAAPAGASAAPAPPAGASPAKATPAKAKRGKAKRAKARGAKAKGAKAKRAYASRGKARVKARSACRAKGACRVASRSRSRR